MEKEKNSHRDFLLAVLTLPAVFDGEAEQLEGLLEAGLAKLHIRKPGIAAAALEALLNRLSPKWASRLVLHGSPELAARYGIPQVHGSVEFRDGGRSGGGPFIGAGPAVSTSVHSWEELRRLPDGLAYAFISPLFDSISKLGYTANSTLLQPPLEKLPCLPVGMGGVGPDTIRAMIRQGWKGAAVLGWIWAQPGTAVSRYEQLKKIVDGE